MKKLIFSILMSGLVSLIWGQTTPPNRHILMLEVDPLPYAMGGVGGHIGWQPRKSAHFAGGLSLIAGAQLPGGMVKFQSRDSGEGWHMRINQGMGLWGHYYFTKRAEGWFVGLQMFTQETELSHDGIPGETNRTNQVLIAAQAGYAWYPFPKLNFYLRPWAGVGYQKAISGTFEPGEVTPDMSIGDQTYKLRRILPFATLHIGYAFGK